MWQWRCRVAPVGTDVKSVLPTPDPLTRAIRSGGYIVLLVVSSTEGHAIIWPCNHMGWRRRCGRVKDKEAGACFMMNRAWESCCQGIFLSLMEITGKVYGKDLNGRRKWRRKREGKTLYQEIPNSMRYSSKSLDWTCSITNQTPQTSRWVCITGAEGSQRSRFKWGKQVTRSKLGRLEQDRKQVDGEKQFRMEAVKNSEY